MCNPRRVAVTATRQLSEAWQREISRVIELSAHIIGEARVRQPLGVTMGGPTLRALEAALAADGSGWTEVAEGYRYEVEGGYVTYLVDEQALEIVAVLEDNVQAAAKAITVLEGRVDAELSAKEEVEYYEEYYDYTGQAKEIAERKAHAAAEQKLAEAAQAELRQAADQAEAATSESLETQARSRAQEQLQQLAAERRSYLAEQARQHLEAVGVRGRHAFHQVMATAYRDALLAYARQHGADNVQLNEGNDIVEIEFAFSG